MLLDTPRVSTCSRANYIQLTKLHVQQSHSRFNSGRAPINNLVLGLADDVQVLGTVQHEVAFPAALHA
jgi:hypothetical protein